MFRTIALTSIAAFVAATTISLAPPARAQIGNIFSEPTPRPPGNIPRGGNQPPPDDEEEQDGDRAGENQHGDHEWGDRRGDGSVHQEAVPAGDAR